MSGAAASVASAGGGGGTSGGQSQGLWPGGGGGGGGRHSTRRRYGGLGGPRAGSLGVDLKYVHTCDRAHRVYCVCVCVSRTELESKLTGMSLLAAAAAFLLPFCPLALFLSREEAILATHSASPATIGSLCCCHCRCCRCRRRRYGRRGDGAK